MSDSDIENDLKKLLEKQPKSTQPFDDSAIDEKVLNKVVNRMQKKYLKDNIFTSTSETNELRAEIEYGPTMKLSEGSPRELLLFQNKYVRFFGHFYNYLRFPLVFFLALISKTSSSKLRTDLQTAGMSFSPKQFISLVLGVVAVLWIMLLAVVIAAVYLLDLPILAAAILLIVLPIIWTAFGLLVPGFRANRVAADIDRQLPFVLRHMAIEVKAGLGIFQTMESVAVGGYGVVSKGFRSVLLEMEKGVAVEDALEAWASNSRSDGLRRTISHLIRALRTGGNLSAVMITIAEDISFERKSKIQEYSSKLNLISLFLLMTAIVFPVMLTILTAVSTTASLQQFSSLFGLFSPLFLAVVYFVLCPLLMVLFILFIRSTDPG